MIKARIVGLWRAIVPVLALAMLATATAGCAGVPNEQPGYPALSVPPPLQAPADRPGDGGSGPWPGSASERFAGPLDALDESGEAFARADWQGAGAVMFSPPTPWASLARERSDRPEEVLGRPDLTPPRSLLVA